ncbi:DNA-directed RNA polymerase protein [Dioscorea alata]|uniref:DNA-directed RNA polymerase protein n=8 Tax=Dioscorea alata TaxID=55571 RepID=A0ACB7W9M4_DIOAL|nr:DNA-directed RNA polymerase protein [Dioscorea alata]KAH7684159.1 DNA-directed RNA polymerase protein [Dioscorea alata]KAH7684161.1 DNA-directed RNA polymerase protein [Dioscorea alata]
MPKVSALDMPDVPKGKLPEHLEVQRTRVVCNADAPIYTEPFHYSGAFALMGVDNSVTLESFCKNLKIEVIELTEDTMEFDMIGIDASLANAFRRILIAEVPTMAIENVLMVNNTSVIPDEVLAHRLGLIPLNADPKLFEYLSEHDTPNERNTIVFKLAVSCKKGSPRLTVKSDQLKWLPGGSELEMESPTPSAKPRTYTSFSRSQDSMPEFANKPLGVKHQDIIIDKLGPGQAIELEAHAVKGIGKVHAKWSPVATAWYRMLPEVILLKEIKGVDAEKLVKKCPVNVFDIEDVGKGGKKAVVANPRACTLCRECIRGVNEPQVELRRAKDHFIFKIESAGAIPPEVLFTDAVKILEEKCDRVICELS